MSQTALLEPVTQAAKPRRRIKWLYRFLWSILFLIMGGCLYWSWAKYAALAERDALIAELHAKGEPVWWREVVAKAYAEQPEKNAGSRFREALALLDQASTKFPPSLP